MWLHFPGVSIMKKGNTLLTTCLIVFLFLSLAGCRLPASTPLRSKTQGLKTSAVNTLRNMTDEPGPNTTVQPNPITTVYPSPSTVHEFSQPVFMPFISKNDSIADAQSAIDTQGESSTPTVFWPTPVDNPFATPYVRPTGTLGEDLPPERWQEWPVLPVISDRALDIYRAGILQGNDPTHFSKVGDCQNIHQYFLGLFDTPGTFRLGEQYAYLQETLDYFSGSWMRASEAVRTGFNVASVLAPLQANPETCQPVETPLACEIRIWNPSIVIISMETWTAERPVQAYEDYLRQIVEFVISKNVLPIVATKADNLEGDNSINQIVANVAADYDIPLWNFWAGTQPLTAQGLEEDRFHLTNGPNYFDSAESLDLGWPIRNLTGLLTIDTVWKAVR
jgi:hypothetical protein